MDADGDDALNMDEFRRLYAETHPGQAISDEVIKAAWGQGQPPTVPPPPN